MLAALEGMRGLILIGDEREMMPPGGRESELCSEVSGDRYYTRNGVALAEEVYMHALQFSGGLAVNGAEG